MLKILNPFSCEKCGRELQPENIGVAVEHGNLIRICLFCGNKVKV
jgi:hypothetical protein